MSWPARMAFSTWGDDGVVEPDDTREEGLPPSELPHQVLTHLLTDGQDLVPAAFEGPQGPGPGLGGHGYALAFLASSTSLWVIWAGAPS